MRQWLIRVLSGNSSQAGDPIYLDFPRCGHYIENRRPPVMSERDRAEAVRQARLVPCPNCNAKMWVNLGQRSSTPELLTAMKVVK
jgi:hypothetical protein